MTEIDQAPVLPRELTSLSAEVQAVGAPPIPQLAGRWTMRLAHADVDSELLSEWMNRPHLAAAWEYDWPAERWGRHLKAQLDGEYSRPFIVSHDGVAAGYVEVYWAAKDSIAPRYDAQPHDLGIHAAIADEQLMQRRIGMTLMPLVAASLFELVPECRRIMFDPDHRNVGARRLVERGGAEFLGEHDMSNRRMALYALARPSD
ncbi:acetyltransferase [Mycobacterium sp. CBMA293]|uniref:GNAT family N-acetyltransferase n=1 Tax=unclassified Mycolicibacterium TaxID=2636767 RepID=UPI0012DCD127|nr:MULTISPECIES: GNAT family N-acetyltransferase [unclassified Mycolicibacterium]MUL46491.1 acetyltransferase [Mycolicibacterium sp. CBMA 360]MUL56997.1 acetyltransferase [Mycolicibacterium sp. CBMA 335]MUL70037.1 acetyltransferase [Mycolicibacterium sp. CBMA 311]MUL92085.1 acetyltransferase [Mycolicibacterium sp. CBMA 230]MUM05823.1 acetyltransferase [Mycolicibacterium sp. CBMA 213]